MGKTKTFKIKAKIYSDKIIFAEDIWQSEDRLIKRHAYSKRSRSRED